MRPLLGKSKRAVPAASLVDGMITQWQTACELGNSVPAIVEAGPRHKLGGAQPG